MRILFVSAILLMFAVSSYSQTTAKAAPTAPPYAGGEFVLNSSTGAFNYRYNGADIMSGKLLVQGVSLAKAHAKILGAGATSTDGSLVVRFSDTSQNLKSASGLAQITQNITLTCDKPLVLKGTLFTSGEGFPCEMGKKAQSQFPIVRNTVGGPSDNSRNDAVYDRKWDWAINSADDSSAVRITPLKSGQSARQFSVEMTGTSLKLDFRPHYYQTHKNLRYFEPWTYEVWPESVAGWCSWWAYRTGVTEQIVSQVSDVFSKRLKDYGFEYIQIDDGYQKNGYGTPEVWLNTNERFPSGLAHLANSIKSYGLKPALWVNVHFSDPTTLKEHPDYFIPDPDGKPHNGPWIDYGIDASNPKAMDALVHPVYRTLKQQGWQYIKVDTLRHLLYDDYYQCRSYFTKKGLVLEDVYRDYIKAIRSDLGPDTYMLACWGVIPEVGGIANGCRLGGDGFGQSTLLQYNSWNNIVWRNDPDHMDLGPAGEEWIRPLIVTMCGAQMLLSDHVDTYEKDEKIAGVKRCSPILFTTPGQLYDIDPSKTNNLIAGKRNDNGGGGYGPLDADQHGITNEWWMMEINRPFASWDILARMDYKDLADKSVSFADLGLSDTKQYVVFEYKSAKFMGIFKGSFTAPAQKAKDVSIYAIHEYTGQPQLMATNRHISCGGPDLQSLSFKGGVLSGTSKVVANDPYKIYIHLPAGYKVTDAKASDAISASVETRDDVAVLTINSTKNVTSKWTVNTGK